jgi:hypothetical protein
MINNKCLGLVLIMGFLSNVSQAAITDESKSPLGCRDQGYRFKLDTLRIEPEATGERQSLYFIFNKLNQPVSLYQMLDEESSHSLALNHLVNPRLWSVLATSEKELKYICAIGATATQRGKIVNCADSLKVCEYARVKFGLNNRGNYWFFNSSSSGIAVRDVLHYGIIPR